MASRDSVRPAVDQDQRDAIGRRLRTLRDTAGKSLRDAATDSGLSHSFIRMVENGESEIGVGRLLRLCESYGAYAADVLTDMRAAEAEHTPAGSGIVVPAEDDLQVMFLATPSWALQPFFVTMAAGAAMTGLRHHGDEFVYGLAGMTTVVVREARFELAVGDSLIIPQQAPHDFRNESTEPSAFVGSVPRAEEA